MGVERSPVADLSPLAKAIYERTCNSFTYPGQDSSGQSSLLNGRPPSSRKSGLKPETPEPTPNRVTNAWSYSQNRAKIEVAIPQKTRAHEYIDFEDSTTLPLSVATASTTPVTSQRESPEQQRQQPDFIAASEAATINPSDLQLAPAVTPVKAAPPSPRDSAQKAVVAVQLPATKFNKDEYEEINALPDAPEHLSSQRRTEDRPAAEGPLGSSLDQKEQSIFALQDLDKLRQDISGAVGQALAGEGASLVVLSEDNELPSLTASTHKKVQAALRKVINLGSYAQVPLQHLIGFQRLCESSLGDRDWLELKIDDTWGEPEVAAWVHRIPDIETALRAARTSLLIMSGGREEKQLYSEKIIQQCLDLLKNVMDGIIIPMVELRNTGSSSVLFKLLSQHKKDISPVFTNAQKLFAILASLVTTVELSDSVINSLEFSASQLIFVENAHYEKDSAIGVQKFDGLRLVAMDMLCQIFLRRPSQRQGIFDEILTSLEKLPVGKQSARHFKLADGGSIQPVSALMMRLVQASCGKVDDALERKDSVDRTMEDVESDGDARKEPTVTKKIYTVKSEEDGYEQFDNAIKELQDTASPLVETAKRNAGYVSGFIINRALKSTKSGDTPYRNLLDLFVEDFTTCLDSPDWPGAELLLRYMMLRMVQLSEGERTAAPAKNMALDVLGTMGAAISRLRSHVRKTANSLEVGDSDDLAGFLSDLALASLEQRAQMEQVISWSGPFRVTIEHLETRCLHDPHLKGSASFLVCEWAHKVYTEYESLENDDEQRDRELGRLGYRLRMMLDDRSWMSNEYAFKAAPVSHARLAYAIVLLRSQLCESFGVILNIVLGAMASDQATVRSKSLKSVNQILETDPAILDGDSVVIQLILQCAGDSSPQVRDSALGLIGKCIAMRPQLEEQLTPRIIDRFMDAGTGARKRAMKLARDIYLRNRDRTTRVNIASGLLLRVQDPDEGVRDLARQMIEEIWFAPFYHSEHTPASQAALLDHVGLMVQVAKSGHAALVLDKVLQTIIGCQNKPAQGPLAVCKRLVVIMFELMDSLDSDDPTIPSGRDSLQVLMTFAKADPQLFSFEQIRLLKPHLSNFSTTEDLHVFRAAVVIYRRVLPQLPTVHSQFFTEVRTQLLGTIGKINKVLLDDVMACVWILCGLLNAFTPLARLALSTLLAIQKIPVTALNGNNLRLFQRYAEIAGMVGKHCDLDGQIQIFKEKFPKFKGKTVPALILDTLIPFAAPERPKEARKTALDAVGLICPSWPRNFISANVFTTFDQVFEEQNPELEELVLGSIKEFLLAEERKTEAASENTAVGAGAPDGDKKRELTVMGGTNYDGVSTSITNRFLGHITRIAMSSQDDHALLAVEVLGSVNRQGLVHPKETGRTFIPLMTSSNPKIAEAAYQEYRLLHEKHETMLEREYSRAIQSTFKYQSEIVGDVRGATSNPFQSKLHLLAEVLKVSKSKNRQKLLTKLVSMVDFDASTLDIKHNPPHHVLFARFLIENLAFFEYITIGEVLATVGAIEKVVTETGAALAHTIESDVFNVRMDLDILQTDQSDQTVQNPGGAPAQPAAPQINVDEERFRQLASGAIILLVLWEARTYLRRLYGLGIQRRDPKAKAAAKDLSRSAVKVQGITGDKLWEEASSLPDVFANKDAMVARCRAFVELLNVDQEFKIADDDEDMLDEGSSQEEAASPVAERGRKRKGAAAVGSRKKRARSSSRPMPRGRPRKVSLEEPEDDFDD